MSDRESAAHRFRRYDGRPSDEEELGNDLGMTGEPAPLGKTLEQLVNHLGAPPISVLRQLQERWPDVVGPGLSSTTRPIELVDGVLTIGCEDGAWAAQVGWMEAQIKQRFAAAFGEGLLQKVVVRTDR